MKPTLVIVGGPTSASPLCSTGSRAPGILGRRCPGLTRDRHYGVGRLGERPYLVVDTGGLERKQGVFVEMARQARTAIAEGDVIVLVTDAREGLTARDARSERSCGGWQARIRRGQQAEGMQPSLATLEFTKWGSVRRTRFPPSTGKGCATWSKPRLPISR